MEKQIRYSDLEVGDWFIHNNQLYKKLKPIPPVIPISNECHGKATIADAELFPIIEEITV